MGKEQIDTVGVMRSRSIMTTAATSCRVNLDCETDRTQHTSRPRRWCTARASASNDVSWMRSQIRVPFLCSTQRAAI